MIEYIVGVVNLFDNELEVKIVDADNWKEALEKHPQFTEGVSWLPDDLESAKAIAFNADIIFTVVEKFILEDENEEL